MRSKKAIQVQRLRVFSQFLFLGVFFFLLLHASAAAVDDLTVTHAFFHFDPLWLLMQPLAGKLLKAFLLALIPVVLTFIFGRFFCGWVCPLGTLQQFFTWLKKSQPASKQRVNRPALRIKYFILIAVVVASLFGTQLAGWLDPFSFLTRSASVSLLPAANFLLQHTLQSGAAGHGWISQALKPLYDFSRRALLTVNQRHFALALLIGGIFLLLLGLNLYRRRFFCNTLCPLGALYGLLARYSLIQLKPAEGCSGCNACANHCPYYGSPFQDYLKSECILCFNCLADCRLDKVDVRWSLPSKGNRPGTDLGRRRLIGSLGAGLALASLPRIATVRQSKFHRFIRPPGSVGESDFLKRCIRCGECMQACPTNAIQPAVLQGGLEGLWTPVLVPVVGYCEYECHRCTQVCPTAAIAKLTLEQKKMFKIGTAAINRSLCYTYADGYNCAVCEEHCPVPEKAIRLRDVAVYNFRGKLKTVRQVYVVPDLCIGCGICENVCPRTDAPAITVGAEEEARESEI